MAYTIETIIKLLPTDTGLTLKVQLVNGVDGSNNGGEITTTLTELGGGEYAWYCSAIPDDFRGYAKILSGSSTYQTSMPINPENVESIANLNDLSAADVAGELTTYDAPTKAELDSAIAGLNNISTSDIDTALATYDAPTKTEMDTAFTNIQGATYNNATDSLEAIRDRGDAAWSTGGTSPTAADIRTEIDSNSTQLAAIKTKTDLISSGSITVTSPVNATTNEISIIQGDDYSTASGNAITFDSDSWADLTDGTVTFSTDKQRGGSAGELSGVSVTISASGGSTQTISLSLTNAQTAAMSIGDDVYRYDIQAVLSGGEKVTLVRGTINVTAQVST